MKLEENLAFENVKKFLASEKKEVMEYCYFSIINDQNERYFKDAITIMEDNEFDSLFPLVSMVILTANKIECDSLNYIVFKQQSEDLKRRKHKIRIFKGGDLGAPDAYIFKMDSTYILHLNAYETGANTPGGSTDLVRFISDNSFINPTCIVSFGICYGRDPQKQNIGDVLIPKKLYTWSVGQKIGDEGLKIKHDNFNFWLEDKFSESGIYSILSNFCNGDDGRIVKDFIKLEKERDRNENGCAFSIKVVWGNMSTGEAVVSSQKFKQDIRKATGNEKEFGGEMEGYGIAKECIYYADIPCFMIKAICDWGMYKNIDKIFKEKKVSCPEYLKDKLQAYAAFCSAITLLQLLNSEEEVFLSLGILKWMSNQKRNSCILKDEYVEKEKIIKNIRKFYHTDVISANKIFKTFLENNIFIRVNNKYRINYKKGDYLYGNK